MNLDHTCSPVTSLLKFYAALGWDGKSILDVSKVYLHTKDYNNLLSSLLNSVYLHTKDYNNLLSSVLNSVERKDDMVAIALFWASYGPSTDPSVKEGTVLLKESLN